MGAVMTGSAASHLRLELPERSARQFGYTVHADARMRDVGLQRRWRIAGDREGSGAAPTYDQVLWFLRGSSVSRRGRSVRVRPMRKSDRRVPDKSSRLMWKQKEDHSVGMISECAFGPSEPAGGRTAEDTMRLCRFIVRQEPQRARHLSSVDVGRQTMKSQRHRTRGKAARAKTSNVPVAVPITTGVFSSTSPDCLGPSPRIAVDLDHVSPQSGPIPRDIYRARVPPSIPHSPS